MFGFLNVYKSENMTSFDVIRVLRKVLNIKQIGHTGTLDPLAKGVLPVCIGKCTKLIDYLQEDKGYIADIQFGYVSETFDTESDLKKVSNKKITDIELTGMLKNFEGEIEQVPPVYSAIKVRGKKLYEYARAGLTEKVDIPVRKVEISKINLLEFNDEKQTAKIEVYCSKGTYIRSIVNDLGKMSGAGAVMSGLVRVKSGKFTIENSVPLDELNSPEVIVKKLINPLEVLSYNSKELNQIEYRKIVTGQKIPADNQADNEILLLTKDNNLVAIGKAEKDKIKGIKVFV